MAAVGICGVEPLDSATRELITCKVICVTVHHTLQREGKYVNQCLHQH